MRGRIRIFSFFLAVFAVFGGLFYREYKRAETYRRYLDYSYQRAFAELVTSITEIDTSLKKSVYSTTPAATCSLCAEIYSKSAVAQMSLGELPIENGQLRQTSEFIGRVGDYTYSLTKRLASGGDISDEERENLKKLSNAAGILSDNFKGITSDMNWGLIESNLPEMPKLIYDGLFSDHIAEMSPKSLDGESIVDEETALIAAADFTGVKQDKLKFLGESDCDIESYYYTGNVRGGNITVQVSKSGGKVISFLSSRKVEKGSLTSADAVKVASGFLDSHGYNSMEPIAWIKRDGTVTVSFAYREKDIAYYPDLIKVSVALDNGAVTDFESMGYLMNHTIRDIPAPELSAEKAGEKLPDGLTVINRRLAIIPSDGQNEVCCYEFRCRTEDGNLLYYVNARTGEVERILIVQENENGVLVL